MKHSLQDKIPDGIFMAIAMILILGACFFVAWGVTCLGVWAICLCFGWTYSWKLGTGIWLIIVLFRWWFTKG